MAAVTIHSDFGAKKIQSVTASIFCPSIGHEVVTRCHDFFFIIIIFEYSVLSQIFLFPLAPLSRGSLTSSSLSAVRVVSSAYMRLFDIYPGKLDSSL